MKKRIYTFVVAATISGFTVSAGTGRHTTPGGMAAPVIDNATITGMHLHAAVVNSMAEVNWTAAKQINVRRYELEKSSNGQNFMYVTAVAGNSIIHSRNFFARDRNLFEGLNYYRLKIIDSKGNFYYSAVATLDTRAGSNEIKILPVPVKDKLHIWMPANTAISSVDISDAAGRKLSQKWRVTNASNLAEIEMAALRPGFYAVKMITNKGDVVTQKFMKQ